MYVYIYIYIYGVNKNFLSNGRSPLLQEGVRTDRSNYRGISLSTSYKILSIILSLFSPYVDELLEIISVFHCNRSTTVEIFFLLSSDTGENSESTMRQYISYS
jgi:hypothetical protein